MYSLIVLDSLISSKLAHHRLLDTRNQPSELLLSRLNPALPPLHLFNDCILNIGTRQEDLQSLKISILEFASGLSAPS